MTSPVRVILILDPTAALPSQNAAYASTVITLTDSASALQTSPAFDATKPGNNSVLFASVADGPFTGTVTEVDTSGASIGSPLAFNGTAPISSGGTGPTGGTFPNATGVQFAAS